MKCKIFASVLFLAIVNAVVFDANCLGQSTSVEKGEVVFVKSYPDKLIQNSKGTFLQRINNIVFGSVEKKITKPVSLIVDSLDIYWILDQESKALFEGTERGYKQPKFIEKTTLDLASLVSISNFTENRFLITDSYLNKILVIDHDKKKITFLNDSLVLNRPTGLIYNSVTKNIWVSETGQHQLLILDGSGNKIKTIGKRGISSGEFNFPTSLTVDNEGNVYVVDAMNFRIQIFNKEGEFISSFGSNGDGTGSFASPKGISIDSYGHIYVVDALFNAVQIFDKQGSFLYTFGTQGHDDSQFWMPSGIFIDKNDHIFVADTYNSRVQEFQLKIEVKK
jgi:hypothetical protein